MMGFDAMVNGIPLVAVVLALVEWIKSLGLEGRANLVASLLIGLLLGVAYQVSLAPPADFAAWFGAVIYGLALGLAASGLYNVGDNLLNKRAVNVKELAAEVSRAARAEIAEE